MISWAAEGHDVSSPDDRERGMLGCWSGDGGIVRWTHIEQIHVALLQCNSCTWEVRSCAQKLRMAFTGNGTATPPVSDLRSQSAGTAIILVRSMGPAYWPTT